MSLSLIFHIFDFHNLEIVNNIFFFIFEGVLYFCLGVYELVIAFCYDCLADEVIMKEWFALALANRSFFRQTFLFFFGFFLRTAIYVCNYVRSHTV